MTETTESAVLQAGAERSSVIVVGYSARAEGRAALQRAMSEATLRGSSLLVVHTAPDAELVVRKLLPLAAEGLRRWEVDEAEIGRLLDVIERRCLRLANGATWQTAQVADRERAGASRAEALRGMLKEYLDRMHSNEPVHTWEEDE